MGAQGLPQIAAVCLQRAQVCQVDRDVLLAEGPCRYLGFGALPWPVLERDAGSLSWRLWSGAVFRGDWPKARAFRPGLHVTLFQQRMCFWAAYRKDLAVLSAKSQASSSSTGMSDTPTSAVSENGALSLEVTSRAAAGDGRKHQGSEVQESGSTFHGPVASNSMDARSGSKPTLLPSG